MVACPSARSIKRLRLSSRIRDRGHYLAAAATQPIVVLNDWNGVTDMWPALTKGFQSVSLVILKKPHRKQRWLLAFKKTNQNTQKVKNERFLISTRQNSANFRSLRGRVFFTYDLQQWLWAKCFPHFVFYISVCRFVEGNVCRKIAHCFV